MDVDVHDCFQLFHHAQAALHFGDDALLFGEGREWDGKRLKFCAVHKTIGLSDLLADDIGNPRRPKTELIK